MINKRVLVLGSTGFIGRHLTRMLIGKYREVISFSSTSQSSFDIKHIVGDFRDQKIQNQLVKYKPEIVVSLIGLSGQTVSDANPDKFFSVNVVANIQFLHTLLKHIPDAKFIFSSSRLEYGKPKYLPVDEKHPENPLSEYGIQKNIVSKYIQFLHRKYSFAGVILRTSNPYGPDTSDYKGKYNVINYFINRAMQGKTIELYGRGSQLRDYLYIDDFVSAVFCAMNLHKSNGQVYNLGYGRGISLLQMSKKIVKIIGSGSIEFTQWPIGRRIVETGSYISNIAKIRDELGWVPNITFEDGIERTYQYQK